MDRAPPAPQTRSRPMTIGWDEPFFTRWGGAVRTEQSRGIAVSVAREDLFLPPVNLPS